MLACPCLEGMPVHFGEFMTQALDVGGVPCVIEPLEHQRHVFALGTEDVWGKSLIADLPAGHSGQNSCGFLACELVPGDVKAMPENGLASFNDRRNKSADIGHGDLLQGARGRSALATEL